MWTVDLQYAMLDCIMLNVCGIMSHTYLSRLVSHLVRLHDWFKL